jgi:hypothetical protein
MPLPVSEIDPLYGACHLAGRSRGADDAADMGEIVGFGSTVGDPGQEPQRP